MAEQKKECARFLQKPINHHKRFVTIVIVAVNTAIYELTAEFSALLAFLCESPIDDFSHFFFRRNKFE